MHINHESDFAGQSNCLYRLAFYDSLTGLPNRANLIDHFRRALMSSARNGTFGALMFCDLDKFKAVNDNYGHQVGDSLLRAAAQRLEQCIREVDLVARHGGDEFIVLIFPKDRGLEETCIHAEAVANKIVTSLSATYTLGNFNYAGSISVGIFVFDGTKDSVEGALRRADEAMYRAKSSGRNQFRFFDHSMQQAVVKRAELDRALVDALRHNEFELHYQPQVNRRGEVIGAEALIRWRLPNGTVLQPEEFITAAEDSGQIIEIGNWVFDCACTQLAAWQACSDTAHLTLSVNIGRKQFERYDLVGCVANSLKRSGADAKALIFELGESLFMSDPTHFVHQVTLLNSLGVRLALVDLEVGGALLRTLNALPIKQLKISRALTREMTGASVDAIIVRSILAVANIFGLSTIGEGIENPAQLQFLENEGCSEFQGYLYKPALAASDFVTYALRKRAPETNDNCTA